MPSVLSPGSSSAASSTESAPVSTPSLASRTMFASKASAASGGTRNSQPVWVKAWTPNSSWNAWKNSRLFLTRRIDTSFE